jgi:DNA invertase Pin-like site-specific DNA recombinase
MIQKWGVQNTRICGTSGGWISWGFNWDKSPSTAGSAPTTNLASARSAIYAPSPGAPGITFDAILVTELSRWGRSTEDLVQTLDDLHSWKVSVLAQNGLSFDLSTASGKLMRTMMAGLAEFERDLIRERVKSGLAAAKARGVVLGRQEGQRPSDKKAQRVLVMHRDGLSYRLIGRNLGLSKNTVMQIVKRNAA